MVVGKQTEAAFGVLKETAQEKRALFIEAVPFSEILVSNTDHGHQITVNSSGDQPISLEIPLFGYHQVENALLAYSCIQELKKRGVHVEWADIQTGFAGGALACPF